ncbi:hypothetical protein [Kitasatospora purpeofusca]|uniref:hypothetical protein n=1 Tax=Kitasatospora purpeofusca TaxID=67352 RepID=UPI00225727C9|nr:hypothetical protein [Kitasatospora purpeofusca]MCX4683314.1 hypothetical protein [Kitasatospora purpeofusca]
MTDACSELARTIRAVLTLNGIPLAEAAETRPRSGAPGAVVRPERHGVSVSWRRGHEAIAAPSDGQPARRPMGSASVMSSEFAATLRLAAILAEAGHHTDHLGDHVLVGAGPFPG